MDSLGYSPVAAAKICGSVHPPRREAAGFAGMVEENDIAVGVAEPRLAPHPRLVARAVLERDPAAREPIDPLVEIVALEIDSGGRRYCFLWVDLNRQGRP